jgi:hypothetical protein
MGYGPHTNKALASRRAIGHPDACRTRHDAAPIFRRAQKLLTRLVSPTGMHALKRIVLMIYGLLKEALLLPFALAVALKQRRQRLAPNLIEAERLDRIRNPSKYLGKS